MNSGKKTSGTEFRRFRAWFDLTLAERKFLLGILAIALIGLVARYLHLKNEKPEPYRPAGIEKVELGGAR